MRLKYYEEPDYEIERNIDLDELVDASVDILFDLYFRDKVDAKQAKGIKDGLSIMIEEMNLEDVMGKLLEEELEEYYRDETLTDFYYNLTHPNQY